MLLTLLRILSAIVGSLAFYVCLFMYEDEEGKWQNRIANLWVSIDDRAKTTRSRTAALIDRVSAVVNRLFDRVFGPRLLSLRAAGASTCYSLAALNIVFFLQLSSSVSVFYLIISVILVVLALLPSLFPSRWFVRLSLLPVFLYWALTLFTFLRWAIGLRDEDIVPLIRFAIMSADLLASLLSDIFLIALIRFSIRWIRVKVSVARISMMALTQACVIILLIFIPSNVHIWTSLPVPEAFAENLADLNVFTGLTACTFLFVLLFLLLHKVLHKVLWPILGRLLYPLARHEIIRNRKTLVGIGTVCYSFASPLLPSVFKSILALVKL